MKNDFTSTLHLFKCARISDFEKIKCTKKNVIKNRKFIEEIVFSTKTCQ